MLYSLFGVIDIVHGLLASSVINPANRLHSVNLHNAQCLDKRFFLVASVMTVNASLIILI